jgi:hypothetical protein
MTEVNFHLYYQTDADDAIKFLQAVRPTLKTYDSEEDGSTAELAQPFPVFNVAELAQPFPVFNVAKLAQSFPVFNVGKPESPDTITDPVTGQVSVKISEGVYQDTGPISTTVTTGYLTTVEERQTALPTVAELQARIAEQDMLNEAKAAAKKPLGRPKTKPAAAAPTETQKPAVTLEEPKESLLMGSGIPTDLESALSINFDEILLQEMNEADERVDPAAEVKVEDLLIEEPEPAVEERSFDELKNMVTAKIKEPAYGMDWFKAVLKTTGAAKLSDLTAEQMRVALDTAHVWLAEKEAVDLLG